MSKLLEVKVVPRAKRNEIKRFARGIKVYLTSAPVGGKANKALIKLLAEHYKIKKSQIEIVRGRSAREKVVALYP